MSGEQPGREVWLETRGQASQGGAELRMGEHTARRRQSPREGPQCGAGWRKGSWRRRLSRRVWGGRRKGKVMPRLLAARGTAHFPKQKAGNGIRHFQEAGNTLLDFATTMVLERWLGTDGRRCSELGGKDRKKTKRTLWELCRRNGGNRVSPGVMELRGQSADTKDVSMFVSSWKGPKRKQFPRRTFECFHCAPIAERTALSAHSCASDPLCL